MVQKRVLNVLLDVLTSSQKRAILRIIRNSKMNARQIVENASVQNTYKKYTSSITTVYTLKKKKVAKKILR